MTANILAILLGLHESFYPDVGGFERNIDSTLEFTLASVSAVRVDSPSTWVFFSVIAIASCTRKY